MEEGTAVEVAREAEDVVTVLVALLVAVVEAMALVVHLADIVHPAVPLLEDIVTDVIAVVSVALVVAVIAHITAITTIAEATIREIIIITMSQTRWVAAQQLLLSVFS